MAEKAANISIEQIKKLKELSGVGLTDAKNALIEANGDFDKALAAMRKKGLTKAEKRGDRETREGLIEAYVHDVGKQRFVRGRDQPAQGQNADELARFVYDVEGVDRLFVKAGAADLLLKEAREAAEKSLTGKEPADRKEQIIASKITKTFADRVLMNQAYIFDDTKTVGQFIKDTIAKTGENITVKQFKRIELGVTE